MAFKSARGTAQVHFQSGIKRGLVASASILAMSLMAQPSFAQTAQVEEIDDTIVVTGSRQIQQDAIALKRQNTQIVDGLTADEIGDIPALSIGEALENITGVTSHRENGGATEVSIRGLGPYLSSTVVNGRAATNGSGDRSVNFSQFPSELINKLAVFKTQDASQIEGGVAGQIQLDTIKPLDFGKRRIQAEIKGNINPDQLNQDDTEAGDIGFRLTGSYTDQFELGNGDIGISIGGQISDISQPEAESRQTGPTSNSRPACLITDGLAQFTDNLNEEGGQFTGFTNTPGSDRGDDDCDDFNDRNGDSSSDIPDGSSALLFEDQRGSDTEGFDTAIDENGLRIDGDTPFVFAPSQRHFRQNDTRDQRDSLFGAIQWAPTDRLEFNLDGQWSERTQSELRNDLTFNGGRRNDTSLNVIQDLGGTPTTVSTTTLDTLVTTPLGGVLRSITDNTIEIQGGDFERKETYIGGGLNVKYDVSERLSVSADLGYSETERDERAFEFRIQSNASPVIEFDRRDNDVPVYTLHSEEFDVNDPSNFVDRLRVRIDNDLERTNEIISGRLDFNYDLGDNFFNTIEGGVRYAVQDYLSLGGGADSGDPFDLTSGRIGFEIEDNSDLNINNDQIFDTPADGLDDVYIGFIGQVNQTCFNGTINDDGTFENDFPESSFLSSQRSDDLVTNVFFDDDGNLQTVGTNSFATFDARCVAETGTELLNSILDEINLNLLDSSINDISGDPIGPIATLSSEIPELIEERLNTIDVEETTSSAYLMTSYAGTLDGTLPISGNIGVRLVQTDVDAIGYREAFVVSQEPDGFFTLSTPGGVEAIRESHSYTRVLPSANLILETSDETLVRLGVFRALSRPDPQDMGFARQFNFNLDENGQADSIEALIGNVSGTGNPSFDPLMSWNYDASFEWYPNEDSILALGAYYKQFQGGFEQVVQTENFDINGESVARDVTTIQSSDDNSVLAGFEVTASHAFTYLPGLLSGFGVKLSYNYATSDFEFEDSRYGDQFTVQTDGTVVQTNVGIIAPGGIPGLSENTLAAQVYYQTGGLDLSVRYKYRDDYFQPFTSDGTRLRFVGDVGVWEARAAYELTDNFRLSAEIINFTSEPKEQFAFVTDDLYEVNDYGPRIFFGIRGRF